MEAAKLSLSLQSKATRAYCWTEGNRILGIVSARPRSGRQAWEVSSLFLGSSDDGVCVDLLNRVCQEAARRGGERVFLRLGSEEPLVQAARLSGFFPCAEERLYVGRSPTSQRPRAISLRAKQRHDDYNLFRLYNAETPSETRFAQGVTFDQWASSRERGGGGGRSREFVYESDGEIRGSVRTIRRLTNGKLMIMVHPKDDTNLLGMVNFGLARLGGTRNVFCLVPSHQVLLERLLSQMGYAVASEYVALTRSMATTIRKEAGPRAVTVTPT